MHGESIHKPESMTHKLHVRALLPKLTFSATLVFVKYRSKDGL